MTEPTPLDYLSAAVIYLIVDSDIGDQGLTVGSIAKIFESRYGLEFGPQTAELVLARLQSLDLLTRIDDRFGGSYFRPVSDFRGKAGLFRFNETENPIAVVLDRFMNGPADWMANALASDQFKLAYYEQLSGTDKNSTDSDHSEMTPEGETSQSATWTGIPSDFTLTEEKRENLLELLDDAERQLDGVGAGNSEKAMARAYIIAAKALADAPEPPVDLIWELIQRANNLAGIASLFVSLIALFTVAS